MVDACVCPMLGIAAAAAAAWCAGRGTGLEAEAGQHGDGRRGGEQEARRTWGGEGAVEDGGGLAREVERLKAERGEQQAVIHDLQRNLVAPAPTRPAHAPHRPRNNLGNTPRNTPRLVACSRASLGVRAGTGDRE